MPLIKRWLAGRGMGRVREVQEAMASMPPLPDTSVSAVVVGHGPAGQTVTRLLKERDIVPTVIETNLDTVEEIHALGDRAVFGDATRSEILQAAGIESATYLVVTVPKAETALQVIQSGRDLNPNIEVLARASYLRDREVLEAAGARTVCVDEAEAAIALAKAVKSQMKGPEPA